MNDARGRTWILAMPSGAQQVNRSHRCSIKRPATKVTTRGRSLMIIESEAAAAIGVVNISEPPLTDQLTSGTPHPIQTPPPEFDQTRSPRADS